MAALNLDMPPRVPRTEFSAEMHWDLMARVTGIDVNLDSTGEVKAKAVAAFYKAWNYDFFWATIIAHQIFGDKGTDMGHAEYAAGGVDYNDKIRCPFTTVEEVLAFDPWATFGQPDKAGITAMFEGHYRWATEQQPSGVNMTGVYVTCMSGLIALFGWDMLLYAAGADPQAFGETTNRYASWIGQYFEALADADLPVVMVHDDIVWTSGPFIQPDWYRKFIFPNYKKLFAPLIESGKKIMYTSDGNYTTFVDDIVQTGVNGLVMEPTTDMRYIAETYGKTHVFIGNADTRILLNGTKEDIRAEVQRCMDIGKTCPGFFMAVGNHIPPNTPVENALYYNECYESLSRR